MSKLNTIGKHMTTISGDGEHTNVTYHSTQVVKFNDDEIILNTGGWKSNTTKTRMNQTSNQFMLGFQVYQKAFNWFVDYKGGTIKFEESVLTLNRHAEYGAETSKILDRVLTN